MRFLLEHYVASSEPPREGHKGIIEMRCSPVLLAKARAEQTQQLLHEQHGEAPRVEVVGDESQSFTFVSSHVDFVLRTLLYNSCLATLRHLHKRRSAGKLPADAPVPPVKVIVSFGESTV